MDGIKNNPNARKKRNGDNSHLSKGDEGIESSADDPTLLWKEVGESLLLSKKGKLMRFVVNCFDV